MIEYSFLVWLCVWFRGVPPMKKHVFLKLIFKSSYTMRICDKNIVSMGL